MLPVYPYSTQEWFYYKKLNQATLKFSPFPFELVYPASPWPFMNSFLWLFCGHYVSLRSGSVLNCCLQEKAGGIGPRVEVAGEKLRCWGYYCGQRVRSFHVCICAYMLSHLTRLINAPTKRPRLIEWIQNQDLYICCLQDTHFRPRDTYR